MKICIIAANNIKYSPYIEYYTRILDENDLDYEVIYPDRNGIKENTSYRSICIEWNNRIPKIFRRISYYNEVKRICNERNYDYLIVLTTSSAVMLSSWLVTNYRGKYIVDIRDYTHENIIPYYIMESIAIRYSAMCIISSPYFREFLPNYSYYISHNISVDRSIKVEPWKKSEKSEIIIGYIGSIAYEEQCLNLMKKIERDERFIIKFYGMGPALNNLKEQWRRRECPRISFYGEYEPSEKAKIISSVDILFNAYGNDSLLLRCALSNKLYDSLFYRKPIITSPNTCMAYLAGPIGFKFDTEDCYALDNLYRWYHSLDEDATNKYMSSMIEQFLEENENTSTAVAKCIKHQ